MSDAKSSSSENKNLIELLECINSIRIHNSNTQTDNVESILEECANIKDLLKKYKIYPSNLLDVSALLLQSIRPKLRDEGVEMMEIMLKQKITLTTLEEYERKSSKTFPKLLLEVVKDTPEENSWHISVLIDLLNRYKSNLKKLDSADYITILDLAFKQLKQPLLKFEQMINDMKKKLSCDDPDIGDQENGNINLAYLNFVSIAKICYEKIHCKKYEGDQCLSNERDSESMKYVGDLMTQLQIGPVLDAKLCSTPSILLGVVEGETERLFYERVFDQLQAFGKTASTNLLQKYKLSDLAVFCPINSKELNPSIEIAKVEKAAYDDLIANFRNYLRYESKSNSFKVMLLEKLIREYEFKRAEFDASSLMTVYNMQRNEICHLTHAFKYSLTDHLSLDLKVIGVMNRYNLVKETQKPRCMYTSRYSIENYVFDPLNLFYVILEFETYWRQLTEERRMYERTKKLYENLRKIPSALDAQALNDYLKSVSNILRKDKDDTKTKVIKLIFPFELSLDYENWLLEIDNLELYQRLHSITCTRPEDCLLSLGNGRALGNCFFSKIHKEFCRSSICLLKHDSKSKGSDDEEMCFLNTNKNYFIKKQDFPLLLQQIVKQTAQDLLKHYKRYNCILFLPEDLLQEFKEAPERRLPQVSSRFHDFIRKNRRSKLEVFSEQLDNDANNPFMPLNSLDQTPLHLLVWFDRNDIILEMHTKYGGDTAKLEKWKTDAVLTSTMRCLKDDLALNFSNRLKSYIKLRTDQDDSSNSDEDTYDETCKKNTEIEKKINEALKFFEVQLKDVVKKLLTDDYFCDIKFDDLLEEDSLEKKVIFL